MIRRYKRKHNEPLPTEKALQLAVTLIKSFAQKINKHVFFKAQRVVLQHCIFSNN